MEVQWSGVEKQFQAAVKEAVEDAKTKAQSCGVRASNELRNSALKILRGQRSGKRYRKPGSSSYYTASAPGEAPAVRTGTLRRSWGILSKEEGTVYTAGIYSDVKYAKWLDDGTKRIAPRPYKDKIIDDARPKVERIFSELSKQ